MELKITYEEREREGKEDKRGEKRERKKNSTRERERGEEGVNLLLIILPDTHEKQHVYARTNSYRE